MRSSLGLTLAFVGLALAGCGGSSSSPSRGGSKAVLRVDWPDRTRLIPKSANSLTVAVLMGARTVKQATIARPTNTNTTQTTFEGLPVGKLSVLVKAYPTQDGTGSAQAIGTGELTTSVSQTGTVTVSLTSTVASLTLVPSNLSINSGESRAVTASAKDASGNVVLLAADGGEESLVWSVGAPTVAKVDGTGTAAQVTGLSAGTTNLRASLKVSDAGGTVQGITALTVKGSSNGGTGEGWPMEDSNAQRNSRGSGPRVTGNVAWTYTPGSLFHVSSTVVGGDGTVYFMSDDEALAYDGATGTKKWEYPLQSQPQFAGPAIGSNGLVYFPGTTKLVALDAASGTFRWSADVDGGLSPAIAPDGAVYVFTNVGRVHRFDGATGNLVWSKTLTPFGLGQSAPLLGTNGLLYASDTNTLFALSTQTGDVKWTYDTIFGNIGTLALGANGTVYLAGGAYVQAVSGANGAFLWKNENARLATWSLPIGTDGTLYAVSASKVQALDPASGGIKWSVALPTVSSNWSQTALSGDGVLYVEAAQGKLAMVETTGGHAVTEHTTGLHDTVAHMAIGGDGTLYIPGVTLEAIR